MNENKYITKEEFINISGVSERIFFKRYKEIPGVILDNNKFKILEGTRYSYNIRGNKLRTTNVKLYVLLKAIKETQISIVNELLKINLEIENCYKNLKSLEELTKSRFIEVFDGKYETKPLNEVCEELFAGGDIKKDKSSDIQSSEFPYPIYTNGEKDNGLYGYTSLVRVSKKLSLYQEEELLVLLV